MAAVSNNTPNRVFPASRVTIMGVLNVTPDSFSDGGRLAQRGEHGRGGVGVIGRLGRRAQRVIFRRFRGLRDRRCAQRGGGPGQKAAARQMFERLAGHVVPPGGNLCFAAVP